MSPHLTTERVAELALETGPSAQPHLVECAQCRAQLAKFQSAVRTMQADSLPPPEAPFSRAKIIAHAISGAERVSFEMPAWAGQRLTWALLALVPLAALIVFLTLPRPMPVDGFALTSGPLRVTGKTLEVENGAVPATVSLADGTRIQADPGTRFEIASGSRVVLAQGRLQLWVQKRPLTPLFVETAEAKVKVVGTAFSVARVLASTRIQVLEGVLEVTGLGLAAPRRLTLGDSLDVEAAALPSAPTPALDPSLVPAPVEAEPPVKSKRPTTRPSRSQPVGAESVRSRVRAGRYEEARRLLTSERAQATSQVEKAELDIVEAEMLLAMGQREQALATYLAVAERHRALGQGEAALFAAAQLSLSTDRPRTERILRQYLERYPSGRLRHEVDALLGVLKTP